MRPAASPPGGRWIAVLAALFTVAVWANFLLTLGGMTSAGLGLVELGFLRAVSCAILLAPVIWRLGIYPKGIGFGRFLVMILGAGFAFMYLFPLGFSFAPPSDSGVFGPGVMPLWVALLSIFILREKIGAARLFGFALIAFGVLAVGGWDALGAASDGAWRGYALFSFVSLAFACYAIAQRGSGLSALEATALVSFWTLPIALGAGLIWGLDFSAVSAEAVAWTVLSQVMSGVVAVSTYTFAIIKLGPSRGSAFIALTPAAVALGSDLFLDQPATPLIWAGIAVVSAGVLISSGVMERARGA